MDLESLGDKWRKSEIEHCVTFLQGAITCEHRGKICYRRDLNGNEYWDFACDDKKDPHDWGCTPYSCPRIGYLPVDVWDKVSKEADNG